MKPARPTIFWLATLAVVLLGVALLHEILLPFVAGIVLAYLLDRPVNRIERFGIKRGTATLLIIVVFAGALIALIVVAAPFLGSEIASLIDNFPGYIHRVHEFALDPSRPWLRKIVGEGLGLADQSSADLTHLVAGWGTKLLGSLWSDGRALLSVLSLLVVTPIVAFYLVYDWNRIIAAVDARVPPDHRETARMLGRDIDDTIGQFLRGQALICLVLATFYAVVLKSIGLNHGVLIGITAGLVGFIPYLGALTGVVLSLFMAIVQFGADWGFMALVIAIFFVGQMAADYVLAPRVIGKRVHLNPVWLMFSIFAFGYLFGFVGVLVAVPLAAAIGVVVRFALTRYAPAGGTT